MKNKWKTIAIIFIILFVLETLIVGIVFGIGNDIIEKERKCAYEVCEGSDFYKYDMNKEACYCYNSVGEMYKVKILDG